MTSSLRFCLALPCLLAFAAPAFAEERLPPSITVNGEASEDVRPDMALITFEVSAERPAAADAASEDARAVSAVIDALKGSGIDAKDIATVGASLNPVFSEQRDPKTNLLLRSVVTGYRAHNEVRVKMRDIERAGAVIGAAVQNGALYNGLSYDLSDRQARQDALRGKAAANAAHRAALYAEGLNLKVGALRSLNATGERAEPMFAPKMFAAAAPGPAALQIEPGTITLSETVTATFDIASP